ncbi:uncharacterized protein V1513DRAFT_450610 [Lipomyces chichibuensis]|uniref:uncharacterized protein n=1 Tax=Lipomyces chichibuensis TaxID=1546026 RepID=UPI0033440AB8
MSPPVVQIKLVELPSKINVFYRESGPSNASVVLLLHGFPSSSHQYRNLIPILAAKYHVRVCNKSPSTISGYLTRTPRVRR